MGLRLERVYVEGYQAAIGISTKYQDRCGAALWNCCYGSTVGTVAPVGSQGIGVGVGTRWGCGCGCVGDISRRACIAFTRHVHIANDWAWSGHEIGLRDDTGPSIHLIHLIRTFSPWRSGVLAFWRNDIPAGRHEKPKRSRSTLEDEEDAVMLRSYIRTEVAWV